MRMNDLVESNQTTNYLSFVNIISGNKLWAASDATNTRWEHYWPSTVTSRTISTTLITHTISTAPTTADAKTKRDSPRREPCVPALYDMHDRRKHDRLVANGSTSLIRGNTPRRCDWKSAGNLRGRKLYSL